MADLYVAYRSDNSSILKVGRSRDPARRCDQLQNSHCFEVRLLALFPGAGDAEADVHRALEALRVPGPGREWYRASPAEVYAAIALTQSRKRPRPPSPERDPEHMARDLMMRLERVRGPATASRQEEIDCLAGDLYGLDGPDVIARAGLERVRSSIGGRADRGNGYFYAKACTGGRFFVKISAHTRGNGGGTIEKGAPRGDDSSGSDEGVAAEGSLEGAP